MDQRIRIGKRFLRFTGFGLLAAILVASAFTSLRSWYLHRTLDRMTEWAEKAGFDLRTSLPHWESIGTLQIDVITLHRRKHKLVLVTNFVIQFSPAAIITGGKKIKELSCETIAIYETPKGISQLTRTAAKKLPSINSLKRLPSYTAWIPQNIHLPSLELRNAAGQLLNSASFSMKEGVVNLAGEWQKSSLELAGDVNATDLSADLVFRKDGIALMAFQCTCCPWKNLAVGCRGGNRFHRSISQLTFI